MATDLDIFSGPAQITLYDATNGYLHLGWCEARIKEKPKKVKSIENQTLLIEKSFDFNANVIQFNENILNNLAARNTTKQTVYLVGLDSVLTLSDIFLFYFTERSFSSKPHRLTIAGSGSADLVAQQVNLLHPDGKFENDSNADGLADGWNKSTTIGAVNLQTSFLSGSGKCQYIACDTTASQYILCETVCPVKGKIKATASIYVQFDPDVITGNGSLCLGLYAKREDGSFITQPWEEYFFNSLEQRRISIEQEFNFDELATKLVVIIHNKSGTLEFNAKLDNAQLEIGKLSNFKEY
ncbi:hypothetical protein Calab_1536 [Caldithrix abyssi DSM 13497]|uniref:Uncharacterized protein n=1 Tax=Caldithrix abyssi DSM 13497 TaxID=880073 RepID=H1XQL0_CALAY|nr:hypothetical protein [Caldithrix abyssi]APF16999.1 hypothetical protein Cabys_248 [Caldithrix abyssi DSM 13497]EHO41156.1 hypothetical protein Calab_1536 [Caldithrix abyssi DSM 13497]